MGGVAVDDAPSDGRRRARRLAAAVVLALTAALPAAAQVHPGGRWLTLETTHFRIHVRPAQESLGVRAAGEAERAYSALAGRLPAPRGAIDLVVSDNRDYANAYATVLPSPRVVLHPYPPVGDVELQAYDRWLGLLVTHELAHVFHLDLARGWWRIPRAVFGRVPGFLPNLYLPSWLVEGTAVHYESALTGSGRDAGSYHPAVVAAQVAEAGGLPIDAANGTSPRWPGGYRPYAFGSAFLDRLAAVHGDSVVERLALATARAPLPYLFVNGALRRVAGISFTRAWSEWQSVERSPWSPAVDTASRAAPEVAGGLRAPVPPRVSRDGRSVLFVRADGRDEARLAVLDRASGAVRSLARVDGALGVAWDTGGAIVAAEWDYTDPYTVRADLRRVAVTGEEERLTRGARLAGPDVAADGSVVAVRVDGGLSALVRWRPSAVEPLTPAVPGVEWAHPRVAPDGRLLAATRAVGGALDVVLLDTSGAVVRAVTSDAAVDQMPAFSPDGRWLFWASDRGGRSQIHATRVAEEGPWWRVSDEPFGAYGPAPAADSVFYLAYHADGYRLVAVPFDTTRWVRLAAEPVDSAAVAERAASAAPTAEVLGRHGYRPWRSLFPKFWLPVGVGEEPASWLGIFTAGQDALERHLYAATLMLGTGVAAGTWQGGVAYRYARFSPFTLDLAYSRTEETYVWGPVWAPDALPPFGGSAGQTECCYRTEDGSVGVSLVHRRFRWSAAARIGAEFSRESMSYGDRWRGLVASATASRVVTPAFAISPQKGWRASALVRRRWLTGSDWSTCQDAIYTEAVADGTAYLPGAPVAYARQVLTLHVAAGTLWGICAPSFSVGGVSGGGIPLLQGISLGSTGRRFPLRGFSPGAEHARRVLAASVEARGPIALVGRGIGLLPATLDRLSLSFFADAALAWAPGATGYTSTGWTVVSTPRLLASVGSEVVVDLGVVYDFPVRLRVGAALRVSPMDQGGGLFAAAGASF